MIPTFYGAAGFQDLDGMFNISKKKRFWCSIRLSLYLGLLPVLSLLRSGIEDGGNRGAVHDWDGEVGGAGGAAERVIGALGSAHPWPRLSI